MFTEDQIAAGRAVQRALTRAEKAHPDSLSLHQLHRKLGDLRDSLRPHLSDDQFQAFGGGTPKTEEPEGGG